MLTPFLVYPLGNFVRWTSQLGIFFTIKYFLDFFETLKPEVQKKFEGKLQLISTIYRVPEKFFKHMTGTNRLYKIRVEVGSDIYRVFSFFDKVNLVILVNGFQ